MVVQTLKQEGVFHCFKIHSHDKVSKPTTKYANYITDKANIVQPTIFIYFDY